MSRVVHFIVSAFLIANLATACATHSTTTRTDTVEYAQEDRRTSQPVERQTTTTRETTSSDDGGGGVISGTVDVLGEILALPFRAVGGLIRAIF